MRLRPATLKVLVVVAGLVFLAEACGPAPTSPPPASSATSVSATPTSQLSAPSPVAMPQPALEQVTSMPGPDHFLGKWAPFGYDAAGLIIAAIRIAAEEGEVTRESVAAAMKTFRHEPYQGVTGTIQFDEYGDLLDQPVYFQKVVDGQWVDVMPEER